MSKYLLCILSDNEDVIHFYKNHPNYSMNILPNGSEIFIPKRNDSGLDLFIPKDKLLQTYETTLLDMEIKCEMINKKTLKNVPYYIYPRSSIYKTNFRLVNNVGIIDAGYRGNIKCPFQCVPEGISYNFNFCSIIEKGSRLVQICSRDLEPFDFQIVNEISQSARGSDGFGSTGK